MGWYYDFHIHDDVYNDGNTLSFGRGGIDEYEWRIDLRFRGLNKDGEFEEQCESVKFTNEEARQLYEWLGKELLANYRWMENIANCKSDIKERHDV